MSSNQHPETGAAHPEPADLPGPSEDAEQHGKIIDDPVTDDVVYDEEVGEAVEQDAVLAPQEVEPTASTHRTSGLHDGDFVPGVKKVDPILVADHVSRTFGGLKAVDVDHIEIPRNAITALIGPNGAGKTTLFNLLSGFDKPDTGEWSFNGRALAGVPAFKSARMGQVRTFQLTKVLARLTVLDSMKLGATGQRGERLSQSVFPFLWRGQEKANEAKALELLERFKLLEKKDDYAASMSGGQRKLLEMARALMTDPEFVLLDEPMAGVNPALTQSLLDHIINLKKDGMTVLFVEHDMHMVRHIADWVVVMAEGRIVSEGPPEVVMKDPAVIDAYLGSHHDADLGVITGRYEEESA